MYKNKRVIVTGGMGFIGRNLVHGLLQRGAKEVVIIDDCSNSSAAPDAAWDKTKYRHLQLSVLDKRWFGEIDSADHVFHIACKTILECNDNPDLDLQVNAGSTLAMLEYIKNINASDRPSFLYTSSASVYGDTPDFMIDESYPVSPCSQYGISKLAGEQYVSLYAKLYGIPARSLRLSNVYGPGQTPKNPYCGVIGIFINQSLGNEALGVIGDGSQTRDFTYVTDVIDAILQTAVDSRTIGNVYNVSSGIATSVSVIAKNIIAITGSGKLASLPERNIDNIKHRIISHESLTTATGWTHSIDIHEGLQKTISWLEQARR